jgi:RNA polymerase sigma factor (sigma-70 family)
MAVDDTAVEVALERARADDARGFDALYRAYGGAVAGYLRARAVADPDGIANEVFLRAFRSIGTFAGTAPAFRSWLFTIAQNAAIDDSRRRKRRVRQAPLDHAPEPDDGGDVENDVLTRLARERVDALLDTLSPDQRDVLLLRIVADLSVEETAAVLDKSYEAVKALQRRALAALRRTLSSTEGVPR